MNEIILYGRLVRDPEVRYLASGKEVGRFTLAVNRDFKNSRGEIEADFFDCVLWGKSTKVFEDYVRKGHRLLIKGRLQTRFYEKNENERRKIYEVVVTRFRLVESKKESHNEAPLEPEEAMEGFASFGSAEPFNENVTY